MRNEKNAFIYHLLRLLIADQQGNSPANKELIMTIREIIQSQPLSEVISGIAMAIVLPILLIGLMVVLP